MKKKYKRLTVSIIFVIGFVFAFFIGIYIIKTFVFPLKHFDIIKLQAKENNIDPYLILAIIKTESGFDKDATSSKEAKGLMQIMDTTAEDVNSSIRIVDELDGTNIYDESINISLGCKYLSELIKRYDGNYYLAICAYNAGMGNVDKWIEQGIIDKKLDEYKNVNIPFVQTKRYLRRVITNYRVYKLVYN